MFHIFSLKSFQEPTYFADCSKRATYISQVSEENNDGNVSEKSHTFYCCHCSQRKQVLKQKRTRTWNQKASISGWQTQKTCPCCSISEVILLMVCSRFVKLHVPMEVLKRYAEILKLRMKLKVRTIKLKVSPAQRKMLVQR